ncbi:hypothetical protein GCM10017776_14240 [Streptomyces griseoluteus]|nr:hypothetical protein GCM10017776_14240 [Streptomyces griseoluteus]
MVRNWGATVKPTLVPATEQDRKPAGHREIRARAAFSQPSGNSRREAHDARQQAEYAARAREYKEQLRCAAEREARRPVCAGCGTRFTDARWRAIEPAG